MSPLPTHMRDRWRSRAEAAPGQGTIYWHILLRDYPEVRAVAREVRHRLSSFSGLHVTPEEWLHVTTVVAGSTDQISSDQTMAMIVEATRALSSVKPIPVTLGRILYHPEAIMLEVDPERALYPILEGVQEATQATIHKEGNINGSFPSWTPHITVAYSTAEQPAAPIIASVGKELPVRELVVNSVSLVIQWGPERLWDWEPVGTIQLRP